MNCILDRMGAHDSKFCDSPFGGDAGPDQVCGQHCSRTTLTNQAMNDNASTLRNLLVDKRERFGDLFRSWRGHIDDRDVEIHEPVPFDRILGESGFSECENGADFLAQKPGEILFELNSAFPLPLATAGTAAPCKHIWNEPVKAPHHCNPIFSIQAGRSPLLKSVNIGCASGITITGSIVTRQSGE